MRDPSIDKPKAIYDQRGQHVHGDQTNIAGDVYYHWPRIAIAAAAVAIVAFALLLLELATNLIEQVIGLTLQQLMLATGVIGALAWALALVVLRAKRNVGAPYGYHDGDTNRPLYNQKVAFPGAVRRIAQATLWTIPVLTVLVAIAYYVWIILPAHYTTILLADFVAPSGSDEALVTQSLFESIEQTLASLPTPSEVAPLRIERLHWLIDGDGGSEQAMQIGRRPQYKATIVIWGNYAIPGHDPEVHLHFDIVQPAGTYLKSGFAAAYGPNQIRQLLQVEQPTMFDFKLSLGKYLGQMTAFTIGLTLYNADRNKEATPFFEKAGEAIGQPLASAFERGIHFYRGTNYLSLNRAKDAKPDLTALIPKLASGSVVLDSLAVAALSNLGVVAEEQDDYTTAKTYLEQGLAIDRQLGHRLSEAADLGNLGNLAQEQGDSATAKTYLEQALAIDRQLGNRLSEANQLSNLGAVAEGQDDYTAAKTYLEQALAIDRQLGHRLGEAAALSNLGVVARKQGNSATAKTYHEQALAIDRQLGSRLSEANQLGNLGLVAMEQGNSTAAKTYHEQALAIYRQLGSRLGEAPVLGNLGVVAMEQGDSATAKTYYEQALAIYRQLGSRRGEAVVLGNLGNVARKQGDYATSKTYLEQALAIDRQLGNQLGEAADLGNLGALAGEQDDSATAKTYLEQALTINRQLGNRLGEAQDLGNLANVARKQGDYATARTYYEQSVELYHVIGLPVPPDFQAGLDAVKTK